MTSTAGISVVIVTRNRLESLLRAVSSISQSARHLPEWELVIVAHKCSDGTPVRVREQFPNLPLHILSCHDESLSQAKNHALDDLHARFSERLVVMTDDDVTVSENWLPALRAAACQWGDRFLFGGPIAPVFPAQDSVAQLLMRYEWLVSPLFAAKPDGAMDGPTKAEPFGPNMAFWLSASKGKYFHQQFGPPFCMGEETVFLRDMAYEGRQFVHVSRARVCHHLRVEQLTRAWMEDRIGAWGRTLARFQLRYQAQEEVQYRIRRFRRRMMIRSAKSKVARCLPGLSPALRLRLHLRTLQSQASLEEYARLAYSEQQRALVCGDALA
jgi:glycosyltransferase involved in cell wall biosynthesis